LRLVLDRQPLDVLARRRVRPFADIVEASAVSASDAFSPKLLA
jgi:hypothetical protein